MIVWGITAAAVAIILFLIGMLFGMQIRRSEGKPRGPHISTESPCPACGNLGCELNYDAPEKKVKRKCKTCGCVVSQPPVAPRLFETAK